MYNWKVYYHLFPNGKYYIGITSESDVEQRWKNGSGYSTQPVFKAIQKYGWNNIEHRSSNAAAKAINGDAKRILNICKHKPSYKTCKGYIFQFEEEYLGGG